MRSIIKYIGEILPVVETVRSYDGSTFKGDLNAGITVGIMLIPQGMAYAILAGLPPVYGLYASLVPLLIYALFGTSRQLAVGPVAMVSLLVIAGVGEIAEVGSDRFIQLAVLTALGVGLVQFLMGLFRMGFLVNFLSHPVLSGFTSAAAIIIGASQIKNLLGVDLPRTNYVHEILIGLAGKLSQIDLMTAVIGIGSIFTIMMIRKWKKTFPSALVVVILGTLFTYLFGLNQAGVSIVGEIPEGLPSFDAGFVNFSDMQLLIPIVLVISLVSYMESIAVAKAIANKHGYKVDANKELVGLGLANIGGSFFQSFPTTGGFSRTAVNDQSGAKTTLAAVVSAGIIGLTVLFLTPLFYYLPSAVLAAIIMVAVAGLFDYQEMLNLFKTDKKDLAMLLITFVATLALGIEEGIGIGVLISLALVIYSSSKPHNAELGRLGDSKTFRNINRYEEANITEDVMIYRFDAPIYFANVEHFRESINHRIADHSDDLELVILDASAINNIDSTGVHMLTELIQELNQKGVRFYIAGAIGPVRDKLMKSGVVELMGRDTYFFDVDEALEYYRKSEDVREEREFSPLQTNV
ncbi:SulP family inorganic anion transporter [Rhodohalobacter sulfatireducens]|uniref:Solute carrier family 26 protein n=1 Tax=Rhodohalobacter sulfatireducens TaxID=2911366 RepID=A0ABS9KFH3_9BACT|nr:solute carrier family 26 protein [Rhodohalobacter sulfatireducens]MCG2589603.1 solute carrier family 26 protein [Rhodohalobacter sulfatireducens]MDR9364700.1 solute carrier family 26 protein [Balneolaceae bacterium]